MQLATRDTDVPAWEWVAERATGATEIDADDARAMAPVLGPIVRALHHPDAARVDGRLMTAAVLRAAIEEHGVEVRNESVDDVTRARRRRGRDRGWCVDAANGSSNST